jgi:hypothetical protein
MNNNRLIIIIAVVALLVGGVIYISIDVNTSSNAGGNTADSNIQKSAVPTNKTDAEIALEAGKLLKESYDDLRENKLRKDSIRNATRKRIWVYQIGLPTTNKAKLLETLNQLNNVSNIKIFQSDKRTFFIYKDDGYSEQELKDSLDFFQSKFKVIDSRLEILDLMAYCKNREEVVKGEDIKIKKEDVKLPCYTCN